jgi:hypothetical protein
MDDDEDLELTKGSKYIVTSLGSREEPLVSTGTFEGYISVGNGGAIILELDKTHKKLAGKNRIIPVHMILAIDIIKQVKKEDEKETESTSRSYL